MAKKAKAKIKLKSNRGAAKRFRKTAGGIKHRGANRSHGFTKKSKKRKRHLRSNTEVHSSDVLSIERLLHGS